MKRLAARLGTTGSALGILVGLTEASIGAHILPWIGNKENPVVLGLLTILLSGTALGTIASVRRNTRLSDNGKLAALLGILLPAAICFTTAGRLWYLPGMLLIATSLLVVREYWLDPPRRASASATARSSYGWTGRALGVAGSAVVLAVFGLAFKFGRFGLFGTDRFVDGQLFRFEVLPMDFVRRTSLAGTVPAAVDSEVLLVMIVYILLVLGAALGLIAGVAKSRLFVRIGGGITPCESVRLCHRAAGDPSSGALSPGLAPRSRRIAGVGMVPLRRRGGPERVGQPVPGQPGVASQTRWPMAQPRSGRQLDTLLHRPLCRRLPRSEIVRRGEA